MNLWEKISQAIAAPFEMFVSGFRAARGDPDAWEPSIRRFEAQDRIQPPAAGSIVFIGSSSFTFWSTLARDMTPLPVLNRGFGGARMQDVVHYAARCVLPYRPRAVVLFAGTNDIAEPQPASAQQVFEGYQAFVECVHAALPETPIYFVSITPSPLRWTLWSIANEANRLIKAHTHSDARLHFIDMTPHLLGPDGKPVRGVYRWDRLHPNKKGYAIWKAVIKPVLQADLFPTAG